MPPREQIVAALASAEALTASLRAALAQPEQISEDTRALTLETAAEESGGSAHTLRSFRGARNAFLIRPADLKAAIEARPTTHQKREPVDNLEDWDAAADRALGIGGGR